MRKILLLTLVFSILLSGCTKPSITDNQIIAQCVSLCEDALKEGKDLSNGHCLSDNNPSWQVENWVCDVAHSPRVVVDNQRENQCNEWWEGYQKGKPPNFVEVDPNCKFIRTG